MDGRVLQGLTVEDIWIRDGKQESIETLKRGDICRGAGAKSNLMGQGWEEC